MSQILVSSEWPAQEVPKMSEGKVRELANLELQAPIEAAPVTTCVVRTGNSGSSGQWLPLLLLLLLTKRGAREKGEQG